MTEYLDRALAGSRATAAQWNEHLLAFHRTYTGSTETLIGALRTADGASSYDVLAARILALAPGAHDILDVGCGDGGLLVRLAARYGPQVRLTGIDLSAPDIARAQARLPEANLLVGDALDVDMSQKSQDVVTSHLAFMLMPEIEVVLARARRALRTPGVLAFVVEDPLGDQSMFRLLTSAFAAVRERFPGFTPSVPGRAPMEREGEMRALLERAGFANIAVEPFCVGANLSDEQLWQFVEQSYPFGLLDATLRKELRAALHPQIARDAAESVLALRLVTALA